MVRTDTHERLGHLPHSDRKVLITYDARPLQLLALNDTPMTSPAARPTGGG
jgi:hypothetical protein